MAPVKVLRPELGQEILLVYRECPCGDWCATGEGAMAPRCGRCGGCFLPATAPGGFDHQWRRAFGLGFRAWFANEVALAEGKTVREAIRVAELNHEPGVGRFYHEAPLRERSDAIVAEDGRA